MLRVAPKFFTTAPLRSISPFAYHFSVRSVADSAPFNKIRIQRDDDTVSHHNPFQIHFFHIKCFGSLGCFVLPHFVHNFNSPLSFICKIESFWLFLFLGGDWVMGFWVRLGWYWWATTLNKIKLGNFFASMYWVIILWKLLIGVRT